VNLASFFQPTSSTTTPATATIRILAIQRVAFDDLTFLSNRPKRNHRSHSKRHCTALHQASPGKLSAHAHTRNLKRESAPEPPPATQHNTTSHDNIQPRRTHPCPARADSSLVKVIVFPAIHTEQKTRSLARLSAALVQNTETKSEGARNNLRVQDQRCLSNSTTIDAYSANIPAKSTAANTSLTTYFTAALHH
jgi:hypothetical protein